MASKLLKELRAFTIRINLLRGIKRLFNLGGFI